MGGRPADGDQILLRQTQQAPSSAVGLLRGKSRRIKPVQGHAAGGSHVWPRRFLLGGIVTSLVSIFVANILFALAWFFWLRQCWRSRRLNLVIPPFGWFFALYAAGVVISIALSPDPLESAINLKKLLQFCMVFLIAALLDRSSVRMALSWIFPVLAASAVYAVLQYFWLLEITPMNRVRGFMSHWMTFSGQLMLGITFLTAQVAFHLGHRPASRWPKSLLAAVPGIVLLCGALVLTQTRNAWLGTAAALLVLAVVYGFESSGRLGRRLFSQWPGRWLYGLRWSAVVVLALVLIFLAMPVHYQQRFWAAFDPEDFTTSIRLELLRTGKEMVLDHPWFGLGPRLVPQRHSDYTNPGEFPPQIYQHLHNNYVQVAAESGLPTFAFWMAMWIVLAADLIRTARRAKADRFLFALSVGGLACLIAFLAAGLFEYNFGDSEVLILLLFFAGAPYAAGKGSPTTLEAERIPASEVAKEKPQPVLLNA